MVIVSLIFIFLAGDSASDSTLAQNPVPVHSTQPLHDISMVESKETRIEEGKLLYERRWFHRGQSVFVEGKDMSKFPGNISAIGNDAVSIELPYLKFRFQ